MQVQRSLPSWRRAAARSRRTCRRRCRRATRPRPEERPRTAAEAHAERLEDRRMAAAPWPVVAYAAVEASPCRGWLGRCAGGRAARAPDGGRCRRRRSGGLGRRPPGRQVTVLLGSARAGQPPAMATACWRSIRCDDPAVSGPLGDGCAACGRSPTCRRHWRAAANWPPAKSGVSNGAMSSARAA